MALTKVTYSMIFGECANVLDFGADPTGVADSSAAFDAAIADSQKIYVPSGTYIVDTISLPIGSGTGLIILGENKETTILQALNTNSPIFDSAGVFAANNYIANFTLKAHASGSTGPAVNMKNISFSTFESIGFKKTGTGTWYTGFYLYAKDLEPYGHCYVNYIKDVTVNEGCIAYAVFLLENNPNAHRISEVSVGPRLGLVNFSIPYIVKFLETATSPIGITMEKFHVECQIGDESFDFGNNAGNICVKDSWIETNNAAFNVANTSKVSLFNVAMNGLSYPANLPLNFGRIGNSYIDGVNTSGMADVLQQTQGIVFTDPAVQFNNPRALDDYEESTFTVTAVPQTSGTITLKSAINSLGVVKVGSLVTVTGMIEVDSVASPVGPFIRIASLPFAVKNLAENAGEGAATCWWFDNSTTTYTAIPCIWFESNSYVDLIVSAASIAANDQFKFSFSYFAD
jgi:hypothetical protein